MDLRCTGRFFIIGKNCLSSILLLADYMVIRKNIVFSADVSAHVTGALYNKPCQVPHVLPMNHREV